VIGHVVDLNPAHAVCGPKHIVRKDKTPVMEPAEALALLDSIDVTPARERRQAPRNALPP